MSGGKGFDCSVYCEIQKVKSEAFIFVLPVVYFIAPNLHCPCCPAPSPLSHYTFKLATESFIDRCNTAVSQLAMFLESCPDYGTLSVLVPRGRQVVGEGRAPVGSHSF